MAVLTFCFIVLAGNNWFAGESTAAGSSYAAAISPTTEGKPLTKKEKRMKKFVQRMVARYHKMSGGGKAALITLAVLVAIGLILLLGAAACSISCGGSEAGAFIVFFLGLGVIIFALVRVIERISKGPRKKKMEGAISQ